MKKSEHTIANTFFKRFYGLMLRRKAKPLFLPKCRSVHTFFMLKPIDLHWVDSDMNVIRSDLGVRPNRFRSCKEAFGVIEKFSDGENARRRDTRGQALVEFALIFPLIFILIFGFIELSLIVAEKQRMTHAVSYAAHAGGLSNDDGKIGGAINRFYETGGNNSSSKYEIESTTVDYRELRRPRKFGDIITVHLQQDYKLPIRIPLPGGDVFDSITLNTKASSRILCNNVEPPHTCD